MVLPLRAETTGFQLYRELTYMTVILTITYMIEKVLNNYLMARSSCFHQRCISIHRLPKERINAHMD